jgi:hypothetical protein
MTNQSLILKAVFFGLFSATLTDLLVPKWQNRQYTNNFICHIFFVEAATFSSASSSGLAPFRRSDQSGTNSISRYNNVAGPSFAPTSFVVNNTQEEEPISSSSAESLPPPHSSPKKKKRPKSKKRRSSGGQRSHQRKTGTSLIAKNNMNGSDTTPVNIPTPAFGLEKQVESSASFTNKNESEHKIRKQAKITNHAFVRDHSTQRRKRSKGKDHINYNVKHRNSARNSLKKKYSTPDDTKMNAKRRKRNRKRKTNIKTKKSRHSKAMLGRIDTIHKMTLPSSEATTPISSELHSKTKLSYDSTKNRKRRSINNINKKMKEKKKKKLKSNNSDISKRGPTQPILENTTRISPSDLIPRESTDTQEDTRVRSVRKKRKRKKISNITSLGSTSQTTAATPTTSSGTTSDNKVLPNVDKIDPGTILSEEDDDKNMYTAIPEGSVDIPQSIDNVEENRVTSNTTDAKTTNEILETPSPLVILENKDQNDPNSNQTLASSETSATALDTMKSIENATTTTTTPVGLSFSETEEKDNNNNTNTAALVDAETVDGEPRAMYKNVDEESRSMIEKEQDTTQVGEEKQIQYVISKDHPSVEVECQRLDGKASRSKAIVDDTSNTIIDREVAEIINPIIDDDDRPKTEELRKRLVPPERTNKDDESYKNVSKFMHAQEGSDILEVSSNDKSIACEKRPRVKSTIDDEDKIKNEGEGSRRHHIVDMPREGVVIPKKDKYQDTCDVRTDDSVDSHENFENEIINSKNEDINLEQDVVSFIEEVLQEDVRSWIKETDSFSEIIGNKTRGGCLDNDNEENSNKTLPILLDITGESLEPDRSQDEEEEGATINDNTSKSSTSVQDDFRVDVENLCRTKQQQEQKVALNRTSLENINDKKSDAIVSVVSWNLAEESPSEEDAAFIRKFRKNGISPGHGSDLVLISGQECENIKPRRSEGRRSREFRRLMIKMLGKEYVPLALHLLGGIQFGLFAKRSFLKDVEDVFVADVTCGIGNVFHNKGAIAAFVKIKAKNEIGRNEDAKRSRSLRMVFVTAHLAAHVKNTEARDSDFWRISSELEAQAPEGFVPRRMTEDDSTSSSGSFLFDSVDRVFFCGDLNYRVDLPRELTEYTILHGSRDKTSLDDLIRHDQLIHSMAEGRAFPGFAEGKIAFMPTFKFDKESGSYDTSHKQRIPAWTDRILFLPSDGIRVLDYQSVPDAQHSDHRPVYGSYRISMKGQVIPPVAKKRKRKRIDGSIRRTTTERANKES